MSDAVEIPLSATEEAFVKMVFDECALAMQQAEARRNARMGVLLTEKHVPVGSDVTVLPKTDASPARLTFTAGGEG